EYASFKFAMFFIAEYTSMITVSCLCSILFFGGWLSPFPASWTFTHYLPSVILIPFGLWSILDGFRYETMFGRIILPGVGTAIAAAAVHRERNCHQLCDPGENDVGREMTAPLVVFFVLAALAVIGAVSLILQKHSIHSALSLIVVMVALAGLYLLLGAEFVAAVQIIVYGGAIMVLFVFVIMLLNAGLEEHTSLSQMAGAPGLLLVVALAGFV